MNLDWSLDDNILYSHRKVSDNIWRVNPGVDVKYTGNEWGVAGNLWYAHSWYAQHDVKDIDRWGERLSFYRQSEKGIKIVLGQGYTESDQNDSLLLTDGDGVWRSRRQLDANAVLTYAPSDRMEASIIAMFSDMWYDNAPDKYQSLYGWSTWSLGAEVAHKLTAKTMFMLSGSYQEYYTGENLFGKNFKDNNLPYSNTSHGYTLMGGLRSLLTERIRYRASVGASLYDYGGNTSVAPSYLLDATWVISDKLAATVAGAGYFQPSERSYYQQKTIYTISAGMTYQPVKKMSLTLDGVYRGEDNQTVDGYSRYGGRDYQRDQYTGRFRVSYRLQRYVSVYGAAEYTYQEANYSGNRKDDWDRFRLTAGLSLRY
ncbi:MAG: hypothetical protein FWG50_02025 [Kiritimatiellaeota bacterium]|nr:hypothetical protein [Kiritimatiellota bacterium]